MNSKDKAGESASKSQSLTKCHTVQQTLGRNSSLFRSIVALCRGGHFSAQFVLSIADSANAQPAHHTPTTFAQPSGTSAYDTMIDDTPVFPFPRQLPVDILVLICATLHAMMSSPSKPTKADRLIIKTLLRIQLVSKAAWRAATPFIWEHLRLGCQPYFRSFFSPITRLLEQGQRRGLFKRSQIVEMVEHDASCPDEIHRFFKSCHWIRTIQIN